MRKLGERSPQNRRALIMSKLDHLRKAKELSRVIPTQYTEEAKLKSKLRVLNHLKQACKLARKGTA